MSFFFRILIPVLIPVFALLTFGSIGGLVLTLGLSIFMLIFSGALIWFILPLAFAVATGLFGWGYEICIERS